MSPKQKFNFMIEPGQLAALKAVEQQTGATVGEQIRRAIQAYLDNQRVLSKAELKALLSGK